MGSGKPAKGDEDEGEIPVLTVLKNNAILKNIFIVNKPPEEKEKASRGDHVDVLLVGRHPDCDLMLTHPSISRFHLQIRSKPSSHSFSVVDLSSVHGTWVSGKRIEPMVSVEMREGDSLRIGVSSRVYRLHWIPISRAYDLENPFVAQLDVVAEEDEEEEEEEKMQKLNCCPAEMELDSIVEDISSLFFDENLKLTVKEDIPLGPWMLEERKSLSMEEAIGIPSDFEISDGENNLYDSVSLVQSPPYVESLVQRHEVLTENLSETSCFPAVEAILETKMLQFHTQPDTLSSPSPPGHENSFEKLHSSLPINTTHSSLHEKTVAEDVIIPKETEYEYECTNRDDGSTSDVFTAEAGNLDSGNMFLPVKEAVIGTIVEQIETVEIVANKEKQDIYGSQTQLLKDKFCHDRMHSFCELVEDVRNKCTGSISPTPRQIESVNISVTQELVFNIMNKDQTLQSDMEILENCVKAVEKTSTNYNIWSRRGKATSTPQVRTTSKSTVKNAVNVDAEVAMSKEKDRKNRTISKNLFSVLDGKVEEEIFTPEKQLLKNGKHYRSRPLSKDTSNCENYLNESIGPSLSKMNQKDIINKTISKDLFAVLDGEIEEEFFTLDKENISPTAILRKKGKVEEIKYSKSKRSPLSKGNESIGPILCKRNQKDIINTTISEDIFSDVDGEEEEEEIFTPNKENISPNTLQSRLLKNKGNVKENKCFKSQKSPLSKGVFSPDHPKPKLNQKDTKDRTILKDVFFDLAGKEEDEELFIPDKENFSPNVLQLRLLKKNGKGSEVNHPKNQKFQRKPFYGQINMVQEQHLVTTTKDREERVPFQSLDSSGNKGESNTFYPVSAAKSFHFSNCGQILEQHINYPCDIMSVSKKSSWDMIVDTTSLVNKESRKALLLLQGLKGTRLIIPRLVIRELDRMARQFKIFRRTSEASLALEWIEECMVKTNWWIKIQSSVDEGRLVVPTPPSSPQTQFSEKSGTSLLYQNRLEIASPTVEDHILDFALLYKRNQNNGQLVLLSEDIILKIKCMAEGLLCESVQEFRDSLVNPFSERFLWTNSSPRGQTWSCQDDVILREKYCRAPLCKSSKTTASGLKLILLHNSKYRL